MIDMAAIQRKIGYYPRCRQIRLTHLCFAYDLMIFVDGQKKSIEGEISIFNDFAVKSGLKISLEKSTMYLAGDHSEKLFEESQNFVNCKTNFFL